jgi:hypothetical protein
LLEDLADEVVRADRAYDAGQREIDTVTRAGRFVRAGFNAFAALFDFGLDVGAELIEFLADAPLEFLSGGLEPIIGDLREHAGFAAQPGIAKLLPGRFVARARTFFVEATAQIGEERRQFLGPSDTEVDERQTRFVFRRAHIYFYGERLCAVRR